MVTGGSAHEMEGNLGVLWAQHFAFDLIQPLVTSPGAVAGMLADFGPDVTEAVVKSASLRPF